MKEEEKKALDAYKEACDGVLDAFCAKYGPWRTDFELKEHRDGFYVVYAEEVNMSMEDILYGLKRDIDSESVQNWIISSFRLNKRYNGGISLQNFIEIKKKKK